MGCEGCLFKTWKKASAFNAPLIPCLCRTLQSKVINIFFKKNFFCLVNPFTLETMVSSRHCLLLLHYTHQFVTDRTSLHHQADAHNARGPELPPSTCAILEIHPFALPTRNIPLLFCRRVRQIRYRFPGCHFHHIALELPLILVLALSLVLACGFGIAELKSKTYILDINFHVGSAMLLL